MSGDTATTGADAPVKPTRMLPKERQWGYLLAGVTAIGFVVVNQPWLGGTHFSFAVFGLLMSLALAAATWWGNRVAGAFASMLVAFGPWGAAAVAGGLPMAYGFLLGFRTSKAANAPAAERARERREARAAARGRGTGSARSAKSSSSKAKAPTESKRVTPKKTPPRGGGRRLKKR